VKKQGLEPIWRGRLLAIDAAARFQETTHSRAEGGRRILRPSSNVDDRQRAEKRPCLVEADAARRKHESGRHGR
jgi:hypothetical protein